MLVCNVSMRPRHSFIAADIAEITTALDDLGSGSGQVVFATLVDDPASVGDTVDAYLGAIMLEAASADAVADASIPASYTADIAEAATAADSLSATLSVASAWNPADKSNVTLSNSNLTAVAASATTGGVRGASSKTTGKYYFEVTFAGTVANSGVGIATASATLSNANNTAAQCAFVNINGGSIFVNGSILGSMVGLGSSGESVCVAVDLVNQRIWFRKNGGDWNGNATNNPATNTGGIDISSLFASTAAFPLVTFPSTGLNYTANFGASAFAFAVPSGFTSGWPV